MRPPAMWLCMVALVLAGCAGSGRAAPEPGPSAMQGAREVPVRPGDRVALKIWSEPAMSDTFTVAETGELTLPKLGIVRADAMGAGALQDSLRTAYAEFLRDPAVAVVVLRRVGVLGEVQRPGMYLADLTTSVSDLITMAGGLTEAGDADDLLIERGVERIRVRRDDRARLAADALRSGDQIVVGARNYWVRNPAVTFSTVISLVAVVLPYLR